MKENNYRSITSNRVPGAVLTVICRRHIIAFTREAMKLAGPLTGRFVQAGLIASTGILHGAGRGFFDGKTPNAESSNVHNRWRSHTPWLITLTPIWEGLDQAHSCPTKDSS
jgi:hypothetical protein